jgi:hypothetical protein
MKSAVAIAQRFAVLAAGALERLHRRGEFRVERGEPSAVGVGYDVQRVTLAQAQLVSDFLRQDHPERVADLAELDGGGHGAVRTLGGNASLTNAVTIAGAHVGRPEGRSKEIP